jgi:hypothetical protein
VIRQYDDVVRSELQLVDRPDVRFVRRDEPLGARLDDHRLVADETQVRRRERATSVADTTTSRGARR